MACANGEIKTGFHRKAKPIYTAVKYPAASYGAWPGLFFPPQGRGMQHPRHSPNIRASAAAWLIARGNKFPSARQKKAA